MKIEFVTSGKNFVIGNNYDSFFLTVQCDYAGMWIVNCSDGSHVNPRSLNLVLAECEELATENGINTKDDGYETFIARVRSISQ